MKKLENLDCTNKRIIVRVDLNVPVFEDKIIDRSRMLAILPTINKLIKNKNKVFLVAHFGRPNGEENKKYSIKFLCSELKKILNSEVIHFLDNYEQKMIQTKMQAKSFIFLHYNRTIFKFVAILCCCHSPILPFWAANMKKRRTARSWLN